MSHVPHAKLHAYQGEDWEMTVALSGSDAPTDISGWKAFMEVRTDSAANTRLVRCTTDTGEITVVADADDPTFLVTIPKATTRSFPIGKHVTDMFLVPDVGATFAVFEGSFEVSKRRTEEETA